MHILNRQSRKSLSNTLYGYSLGKDLGLTRCVLPPPHRYDMWLDTFGVHRVHQDSVLYFVYFSYTHIPDWLYGWKERYEDFQKHSFLLEV